MDAGLVSKAVVVWNADDAARSVARYAIETSPDLPTINAAHARLTTAKERFDLVVTNQFSSNGKRKRPFNEGIELARTAVKLLQQIKPKDVALRDAANGLGNIGTVSTGTWGATPTKASQARAHVAGVLADIESGRFLV